MQSSYYWKLALHANVRLGWKLPVMKITLAYVSEACAIFLQ
jgi:hypothetical protein